LIQIFGSRFKKFQTCYAKINLDPKYDAVTWI